MNIITKGGLLAKTPGWVNIAQALNRIPYNFFVIKLCGRFNLTKQTNLVSTGYCFDTGTDEYCYWYPATDVVVTDVWVPYP